MQQQMENVSKVFGDAARVTVVVGFKLEMIIEAHPSASFVYNEVYDQTNTSNSLLKALRASQESGVLWLNGDVVFDSKVFERVADRIRSEKSFVCVNTSATAEEEVKYTVNEKGFIKELSKTVKSALGEAVGINFISAHEKADVIAQLDVCADQDYFERGLELAIEKNGIEMEPVDISDLFAVEVDFQADLDRANEGLK
jgi:choline kinase